VARQTRTPRADCAQVLSRCAALRDPLAARAKPHRWNVSPHMRSSRASDPGERLPAEGGRGSITARPQSARARCWTRPHCTPGWRFTCAACRRKEGKRLLRRWPPASPAEHRGAAKQDSRYRSAAGWTVPSECPCARACLVPGARGRLLRTACLRTLGRGVLSRTDASGPLREGLYQRA
jgi:hypothetical protein